MIIKQIHAHAFGPLTEQSLDLKKGINIITGENEAGKSAWSGAIYATLCGRRRGKGSGTNEDRSLVLKNKPWDCEEWRVSGTICLHDERVVQLDQDLENKVACAATDVTTGQRVDNEILNDGSIDATVWCNLGRDVFINTAWVSQTNVLNVLRQAHTLQDFLQVESEDQGSFSLAQQQLHTVFSDKVGSERIGSQRPLSLARQKVGKLQEQLAKAREYANEYSRVQEELDELQKSLQEAKDAQNVIVEKVTHLERCVELIQSARSTKAHKEKIESDILLLQHQMDQVKRKLSGLEAIEEGPDPNAVNEITNVLNTFSLAEQIKGSVTNVETTKTSNFKFAAIATGGLLLILAIVLFIYGIPIPGVFLSILGGASLVTGAVLPKQTVLVNDELQSMLIDLGIDCAGMPVEKAQSLYWQKLEQVESQAQVFMQLLGLTGEIIPALSQWVWWATAQIKHNQNNQGEQTREELLEQGAELKTTLDQLEQEVAVSAKDLGKEVSLVKKAMLEAGISSTNQAVPTLGLQKIKSTESTESLTLLEAQVNQKVGTLKTLAKQNNSVPECEEELWAAEDNLQHILIVKRVIERTEELLLKAQDKVSRSVAPRIQAHMQKWVRIITDGRYINVAVDPSTLALKVQDENLRWRDGALLSVGTTEQLFLLLRLALVEQFENPNEPCPLILDDILVNSDSKRSTQILQMLKEISKNRQIILFSGQEIVKNWAEQEKLVNHINLQVPHIISKTLF